VSALFSHTVSYYNIKESNLLKLIYFLPIPNAVRSKALVIGRSHAGIVGIHPVGPWKSLYSVVCFQVDVSASG